MHKKIQILSAPQGIWSSVLHKYIHKWNNIGALIFPPASCCPLWSLPSHSVLTSRYTHPLPQYGDIHRSDMEKQHKHTFLGAPTYKLAEFHNLPDCARDQQTHPLWMIKIKRLCIAGREVVTASLVLTSPQNSGHSGKRWVYVTKKQNRVWVKKKKIVK